MNKFKKIIVLFVLVLIIFSIFLLNDKNEFKILKREKIYLIFKAVKNNEILKYINLSYKNVFLPETLYGKMDYFEKKIKLKNFNYDVKHGYGKGYYKPFYIEEYQNFIYIIERNGNIHKFLSTDFIDQKHSLNEIEIRSDIKKFQNIFILDTLVIKDEIFISFRTEIEKCKKFIIVKSKIKDLFKFDTIYKSTECGNNVQSGTMHAYNFNGNRGILFTLANPSYYLKDEKYLAQNDNSIFGKIHFLDLNNFEIQTFAKGFRNNQGLYADEQCILSTDHGPQGGDEINNIQFNKNYGWPIASYGEPYEKNEMKDYKFPVLLKSHENNNFEEPVFSFLPSIAISRIIKIPDRFSKIWKDNFLVATLNAKSIFRIKFDKSCKRIIYFEKIYIGSRIRDLHISLDDKKIYLALENTGSVGVLQSPK